MSQWHGFRRGNRSIHIGPLPARKSIAFYATDENNRMSAVAYFKDEWDARKALETLDALIIPTEREDAGP